MCLERGSEAACRRLASFYAEELGRPDKAVPALARLCDRGDAQACDELAVLYEGDDGVRAQPARAAALNEKLCRGAGPAQAERWRERACRLDAGSVDGCP